MSDNLAILDAILANIRDAVVLPDEERRLVRVNKAFETLTGHEAAALLDCRSEDAARAHQHLVNAMNSHDGGRWHGPVRCGDGTDGGF